MMTLPGLCYNIMYSDRVRDDVPRWLALAVMSGGSDEMPDETLFKAERSVVIGGRGQAMCMGSYNAGVEIIPRRRRS